MSGWFIPSQNSGPICSVQFKVLLTCCTKSATKARPLPDPMLVGNPVLSLGQMRFSSGPEIDFPRAAACTVSLLSVLFRSLWLSGRAQSLLNSNVSLPFLSVLTGRGGYSLGSSVGARSWKCWPEACHRDWSLPKRRLYEFRESWQRSSGFSETSPGPGSGIKAASGPGGALGGRRVIIQHGGGVRSSPSKSCRISFFIISQLLCH